MGKRAVAAMLFALLASTGCDVLRELGGARWTEPEPEPEPEPVEPAVDSARVVITFRPAGRGARVFSPRFGVVRAEVVRGGGAVEYTYDVPRGAPEGIEGPEFRVIVEGGATAFLRPYADESVLPEDKYWLSMTADELVRYMPNAALPLDLLTSGVVLSKTDPPAHAGRESERVRGVQARRYVRAGTLAQVASSVGIPPDRVGELRRAAPEARRISQWVDRKGLVRRIELPMEASPGGPLLICTIEVFAHGRPLTIQFPVPQDVAPL